MHRNVDARINLQKLFDQLTLMLIFSIDLKNSTVTLQNLS